MTLSPETIKVEAVAIREAKQLKRLSRIREKYVKAVTRENHRHAKTISRIEALRQTAIAAARLAE